MKSNELRIGNIIYDDYTKLNKYVAGVFQNSIYLSSDPEGEQDQRAPIEAIQPIPLTKELLLRFGFDEYQRDTHVNECEINKLILTIGNDYRVIFSSSFYDGIKKDRVNFYRGYDFIGSIKHIHQLQNLYFALTGQELILK